MKGLSNAANATLVALAAAASAPYNALAASIATATSANKVTADGLKAAKLNVWDAFKSAIGIAVEAGHNAAQMRAGLEISCVNAGVPAGTFRGYVSTVESLALDLFTGEIDAGTVAEISVKDARERYMDADKRILNEARAKLRERVKDWDAEQIGLLILLCDDVCALPEEAAPETDATPEAEVIAA